jgi:hypothetical protein
VQLEPQQMLHPKFFEERDRLGNSARGVSVPMRYGPKKPVILRLFFRLSSLSRSRFFVFAAARANLRTRRIQNSEYSFCH